MQKLDLGEIQAIETDILNEIDRVCRELNIHYFLAYGTLLGAARHQGFIPWDDDMDIFMLRADYETLVAHFNQVTTHDSFELKLYRDGVSNLPYAKVVDNSTLMRTKFVKDKYATGVWVDIFPLDFIASETPPPLIREKLLFYTRVLVSSVPVSGRPAWQNGVVRLFSALSPLVDPLVLARTLDEAAQKHSKTPTAFLSDIVGEPEHPRCYLREWFEPIEMTFGDRTYFAPAGYKQILDTSYGNWHEPPPVDQRIPHGVEAYRLD